MVHTTAHLKCGTCAISMSRPNTPMAQEVFALLPINIGDVVAGKYVVEGLLGAGAMGAVVAARHQILNQKVAIKIMAPHLVENEEAVLRFLREARAAALLSSDFVTRVLDIDLLPGGTPFIVMEYLEGTSLAAAIARTPEHTVANAVDIMMQALAGLRVAHRAGIVHRDLKPSNIFINHTDDGKERVTLLDFGVAKLTSADAQAVSVTTSQSLLGTPSYMAPEQLSDPKGVDARADLWAMGIILYELLSHRPAFDAETTGGIFASILTEEPTPIEELRDDVEPALAKVIATCLAKEPEGRYSSALEMMQALAPFASDARRLQLLGT
jgi:serine/threonine protein kinase